MADDLSDFSMLDLFRSEVDTHVETLNDILIEIESSTVTSEDIDALMRAVHSIKGGARIVELDEAVKVAHAMEDIFVAAQRGEVSVHSDHVDTLLQGVDMLGQIAMNAGEGQDQWLEKNQDNIDRLIDAITVIMQGPPESKKNKADEQTIQAPEPDMLQEVDIAAIISNPDKVQEQPQTSKKMPVPDPPETDKKTIEKDRKLRINALKIEQLMGLAGEVVVSARWLQPYTKSLLTLKKRHHELIKILDNIQDAVSTKKNDDDNNVKNMLANARERTVTINRLMVEKFKELDVYTNASESLSDRLYHEIIGVRMCPFAEGLRGYPRMIRDLSKDLGKKTKLNIVGESTEVDRDILERLDAPLNHLLRNAVDHGIETPQERLQAGKPETGVVTLEAAHRSGMLLISVMDDGRGINMDELRDKILEKVLTNEEMVNKLSESEMMDFLFLPGFSTSDKVSEISGRGVGLDVVHNMVHDVGGVVRAVSNPGENFGFHLELPLTLSVIRTFLVEINAETYAFPLARIDRCLILPREEIETVEDRQYFRLDEANIAIVDIYDILEIDLKTPYRTKMPVVIISDRMHAYGLVVDKFLGECDLVVRPLDARLGKVPDISAAAVMLDGSPVLIFDIEDLLRSIDNVLNTKHRLNKINQNIKMETKTKKRVLVVDDSITVRETERKLLENRGYQVELAIDGKDGFNLLRTNNYDMVISDIDMPRMNGFELIAQMKAHNQLKNLPVIIVSYKNEEKDRAKGLKIGADYYLTKSSFQDNSFINAVVKLIGEA